MKSVHSRAARRRTAIYALLIAVVTPIIAGCGDDRPVDYQAARNEMGYTNSAATPSTIADDNPPPDTTPSPTPLSDSSSPLVQAAGDPLARSDGHNGSTDPFAAPADSDSAPTPEDDALARQTAAGGTDHSHWIRGTVVNAHVEVRLNGAHLTDLYTNTDQDITTKCHKGLNTIEFLFTSNGPGASALLNVLESEHTPPIPPLAIFNSAQDQGEKYVANSGTASRGEMPKTVTHVFTFIAK